MAEEVQVVLTEVNGDNVMTTWVPEADAVVGTVAELTDGTTTTQYEVTQVCGK